MVKSVPTICVLSITWSMITILSITASTYNQVEHFSDTTVHTITTMCSTCGIHSNFQSRRWCTRSSFTVDRMYHMWTHVKVNRISCVHLDVTENIVLNATIYSYGPRVLKKNGLVLWLCHLCIFIIHYMPFLYFETGNFIFNFCYFIPPFYSYNQCNMDFSNKNLLF